MPLEQLPIQVPRSRPRPLTFFDSVFARSRGALLKGVNGRCDDPDRSRPCKFVFQGCMGWSSGNQWRVSDRSGGLGEGRQFLKTCLLYTSDAADEEDSVDLG